MDLIRGRESLVNMQQQQPGRNQQGYAGMGWSVESLGHANDNSCNLLFDCVVEIQRKCGTFSFVHEEIIIWTVIYSLSDTSRINKILPRLNGGL